MKSPLRYQIATYDCGPISLMNVFGYLYEIEEIPAIIVQTIWRFSLDCFDSKGKLGEGGTSKCAMRLFILWLIEYARINSFPIEAYYLRGKEISYEILYRFIKKNGVVVVRCYQSGEHYVLITGVDNNYFYIFDPYYVDKDFMNHDEMVIFDWEHPFEYNRIVGKERLFSDTEKDFSLGLVVNRECILFKR